MKRGGLAVLKAIGLAVVSIVAKEPWKGRPLTGLGKPKSYQYICHELCHLQEHNHSPRYYRLLGQVMPGCEAVKARLDGMAELLLNE